MKILYLTVFALVVLSSSAQMGGWRLQDIHSADSNLVQKIRSCMNETYELDLGFSFTQAKIGEVYLYFTQVVGGLNHKVTFKAEVNGTSKIIQAVFHENYFSPNGPKISLLGYSIFDNSAS